MKFSRKQMLAFEGIKNQLGEPHSPSMAECKKKFEELAVAPNSFYWVFNIKRGEVVFRKGVEKYLGIPPHEPITFYRSLTSMKPERLREISTAQAIATMNAIFYAKEYQESLLHKFEFIAHTTWLHVNGQEVLANVRAIPFQFDKNGQMVSHLSWYHVNSLEKYDNEKYDGTIFLKEDTKELRQATEYFQAKINEHLRELIEDYPFSKFEDEIINQYTNYLHHHGLLEKQKDELIAKELNRTPKTIQNRKKKMIEAGSRFFNIDFTSFNDLLWHIKRNLSLTVKLKSDW